MADAVERHVLASDPLPQSSADASEPLASFSRTSTS